MQFANDITSLTLTSTANLASFFTPTITERERRRRVNEQTDIRQNEREMFLEKEHPMRNEIDFDWNRSTMHKRNLS